MKSCLLCQQKKPKIIKISSEKGRELNCSFIIRKHFWFQPNIFEDSEMCICLSCWNAVKKFHQFYLTVAKAHNMLESITVGVNKLNQENSYEQLSINEPESHNGSFDSEIKMEIEDLEFLPQTEVLENVVNVNKPEKKHSNKQTLSLSPIFDSEGNFEDFNIKNEISNVKICLKTTDTEGKSPTQQDLDFSNRKNSISDEDVEYKSDEENDAASMTEFVKSKDEKIELDKLSEAHKKCTDESKLFRCDQCSKSYASKKNLLEHQASHISKSKYEFECIECGSKYATQSRLLRHKNFKHKLSCICELCGKQLTNSKALKRHLMRKHAENPIKCDLCDKWLKHNESLKKHKEWMHNSETHECYICKKMKPSLQALKHHINISHKTEKRFQCTLCEKTFKTEKILKEHINGHTKQEEYTCEFCLKTFYYKSGLRRHLQNLHSNGKSLQCKICNAILKTPDSLKTHIRNQHGESKCEHRCQICGLISVHAAALKRHINRKHVQKLKT